MTAKKDNFNGISSFTAPSGGVTIGVPLDIQDLTVVPMETASATESFAGLTGPGVLLRDAPAASGTGTSATKGDKAYWDASADEYTPVASGNGTPVGWFYEDKTTSDTTVDLVITNPLG